MTQPEPAMPTEQPKVMVVLPTYNERENISQMVPALFNLNIPNFHLLVVDDNSPDGTGQIAEDLSRQDAYAGRVFVLRRAEKQGLGPAYIAGFKRAMSLEADIIIQMDADFSHQPKYIPQLLNEIAQYDLVIGSRYIDGGSVDASWGPLRKLLSWWANRLYVPAILGVPAKDATGGFRIFRRDCLVGLDFDIVKANGYVFQVEILCIAHRLGYRIGEIPIHFPDRARGQSKMSSAIALEAALRVWQIKFRHRRLAPADRRPLSKQTVD